MYIIMEKFKISFVEITWPGVQDDFSDDRYEAEIRVRKERETKSNSHFHSMDEGEKHEICPQSNDSPRFSTCTLAVHSVCISLNIDKNKNIQETILCVHKPVLFL